MARLLRQHQRLSRRKARSGQVYLKPVVQKLCQVVSARIYKLMKVSSNLNS